MTGRAGDGNLYCTAFVRRNRAVADWEGSPVSVPYLTGMLVGLRALTLADAAQAGAWARGPLAMNATRAEAFLKDAHTDPWNPRRRYLAMVRVEDGEIVGGAAVAGAHARTGQLDVWAAPWLDPAERDRLCADAVRIAVPWLRDENELMTVTLAVPADAAETIRAAEDLGMVHGATLREHVARPGGRVDLLEYQALNPGWTIPAEEEASGA